MSGLNDERLELEAFQQRHNGNLKSFLWVDPDGIQQTVRFAAAALPVVIKRELHTPVGYSAEITLEVVV